ncbi:chromosomal replication initiator protein DnaA [Patescibacteria group bacterium]
MSPEQLWNAALGELELELSKANFTTWFEETFIMTHNGDAIIVGVPNNFTKKWLENKYHDAIVTALRRICDQDVRLVSYEVAGKQLAGQAGDEAPNESAGPAPTQTQATIDVSPAAGKGVVDKKRTATVTVSAQPANVIGDSLNLNPEYTFDKFVVGKKTELAHAACMAAAERPGTAYNPLFIYGGVGLGKTHLMQAVGHAIKERHPNKKVLYTTCEAFTNEFITSVGEGHADKFKDKYRSVDVLLVDDVQFLAGKEGTQEAFFHTFNHLHQRNKQIVLTSDRPPRAIPTLEGRLASRFEGGMMVDVNLPDLETRIAILCKKSADKSFDLPPEIAQYIASNVQNNIRELEGALNRIIAHHQLNKEALTAESVQALLASYSHTPKHGAVTTKKILTTVAQFFDVEQKNLLGNSRKKELVVPRQIAMYLMREEVSASYPNIGQELGGRDHTTAMHACQKIGKLVDDDDKTQNDINMIKQRLYNQ